VYIHAVINELKEEANNEYDIVEVKREYEIDTG
jgi:hypothetical protein